MRTLLGGETKIAVERADGSGKGRPAAVDVVGAEKRPRRNHVRPGAPGGRDPRCRPGGRSGRDCLSGEGDAPHSDASRRDKKPGNNPGVPLQEINLKKKDFFTGQIQ